MKIEIPSDDIDPVGRRIRVDALQLPYSSIESLYVNSSKMDDQQFRVKNQYILVNNTLNKNDSIFVYVDVKASRINLERYATIIVAVIGMLGVIGSALINAGHLNFSDRESEDFVFFDVDNYGIDKNLKRFKATLRWEKPPTYSSKLTSSHMVWTFLRLRDNQDDIRAATVTKPSGPFHLKNGMAIEHEISDDMLSEYARSKSRWLQLVVVAMPRNTVLAENTQLSRYGDDAVILINPSIRPVP